MVSLKVDTSTIEWFKCEKKQLLIHWIPHKTHVFAWSLCDSERLFVHASLGSEATIFWLLPHAFHSTGFTCKLGQYQINDEQKLNDFQDSRRQDLKILRLAIAPISLNWLFVDASFPVNYFHPVVLLIQDRLRTLTGNQASPVNFGLSSCNFETPLVYICPPPASSMLWSKDAEVLTGQPWIWTCQQPSVFFSASILAATYETHTMYRYTHHIFQKYPGMSVCIEQGIKIRCSEENIISIRYIKYHRSNLSWTYITYKKYIHSYNSITTM